MNMQKSTQEMQSTQVNASLQMQFSYIDAIGIKSRIDTQSVRIFSKRNKDSIRNDDDTVSSAFIR